MMLVAELDEVAHVSEGRWVRWSVGGSGRSSCISRRAPGLHQAVVNLAIEEFDPTIRVSEPVFGNPADEDLARGIVVMEDERPPLHAEVVELERAPEHVGLVAVVHSPTDAECGLALVDAERTEEPLAVRFVHLRSAL